ncbi:PIN domain-containing protein [Rhizobium herbae]|uniref:Ribonuclease VapC n=1 Tax=Rhizobium herbae TaxID=508661 RepID=A0ABS4ENU0_9HYPH|nr:PIN domain-containing protein [Rhizobium herbae]MBP1859610.1 putative nucleic acid-binding protein [Rhizobium herbae]
MKAFFDTNILVYIVSDDPRKVPAAACLRHGGVISVQVLNEFVHVVRRKMRHDWNTIELALKQFQIALDEVVPLTARLHEAALSLARDHGLTISDALIVAAAMEAGCETLFSEDLQHGRVFGRVTIKNPFLGAV